MHYGQNIHSEDEIRIKKMLECCGVLLTYEEIRKTIAELLEEELIFVVGRWSSISNEPETDWYAITEKGWETWKKIEWQDEEGS